MVDGLELFSLNAVALSPHGVSSACPQGLHYKHAEDPKMILQREKILTWGPHESRAFRDKGLYEG